MTTTDNLNPVEDTLAPRELRLAITMNGGVSLAVYMGGAAHEFNELTNTAGRYHALLQRLGYRTLPAIDVLAGTSAGGINAAALALAQANDNHVDLSIMKRLWIEDGQIGSLLRAPFQAGAPSLLRGDEYFLPKIQSALRRLVTDYERGESRRAVDLTIAATLLTSVELRTADDLGTPLLQSQHAGLFRFRGFDRTQSILRDLAAPPDAAPPVTNRDAFAKDRIGDTVEAVALSARASAGFPVAFEPTFIPVRDEPQLDRPDMAEFADWADAQSKPTLSRFAVDGGVLANTPTRPTLDAIRRRAAADRLVRRVLILIHPHATDASTMRPVSDRVNEPPTLASSLGGVLGASSSVGSRSYVEEIEHHNERALRFRDGRLITLRNFQTGDDLCDFLGANGGIPWSLFHSMRQRRGAYVLAHQVRETTSIPLAELVKLGEKVIEAYCSEPASSKADSGSTDGQQERGENSDRRPLPFLPSMPPNPGNLPRGEWQWGLDLALGITRLTTELLRQLIDRPRVRLREQGAMGADAHVALTAGLHGAWKMAINAGIKIEGLGKAEEEAAIDAGQADASLAGDYAAVEKRLADNLTDYRRRMTLDGSKVDRILREEVVAPLLDVINVLKRSEELPDPDRERELAVLNPLRAAETVPELLKLLLTVEVISYLLNEDGGSDGSAPSSPIEFVQLSAQVPQHFAQGFTSDDKLAGMSLNRFGAFLKRAWRANDWIWGRLDGIKILMQIVLTPDSIRGLAHTLRASADDDGAAMVVNAIGLACFDRITHFPDEASCEHSDFQKFLVDDEARRLYERAKDEVKAAIDQDGSDEPLRSLASLAAYGPQIAAAAEDVPWLVETIRADQDDGASGAFSSGFLAKLAELRAQPRGGATHPGHQLLSLFTDSKIGQEDPGQQLPSDLMIRTAATAAATAVTMLGSERSGLNVAKPAGKLLRGVVALPYWVAVGLTHRGQLARVAAATTLALGVSLVALSLLAPLSGVVSALVPTLGVGSLLTVFAYAALRSRSMVHGAALLGLFVPLLALAAHRIWAGRGNTDSSASDGTFRFTSQGSGFAILVVLILIAGTIVIANINAPSASPSARWKDFFGQNGGLHRIRRWFRYHLKLVLIALAAAFLLVWAVAVISFGQHLMWRGDSPLSNILGEHSERSATIVGSTLLVIPVLLIASHGVCVSRLKARQLRPHPALVPTAQRTTKSATASSAETNTAAQFEELPVTEPSTPNPAMGGDHGVAPSPEVEESSNSRRAVGDASDSTEQGMTTDEVLVEKDEAVATGTAVPQRPSASRDSSDTGTDPRTERLRDPAGLAIAWAGVYGCLYLGFALAIVVAHLMNPPPWAIAASAGAVVLGFGFAVVAIHVIPLQRERRLIRRLSRALVDEVGPPTGMAKEKLTQAAVTTGGADEKILEVFSRIGEDSTYLIKDKSTLTKQGRKVALEALAQASKTDPARVEDPRRLRTGAQPRTEG